MDTVQLHVTKEDSIAAAVAHVLAVAGARQFQLCLDTLAVPNARTCHCAWFLYRVMPVHNGCAVLIAVRVRRRVL